MKARNREHALALETDAGLATRCGGGDRAGSGSQARPPSAVAEVLVEWLEAHRR